MAALDDFASAPQARNHPYTAAAAVTPNDSTDLTNVSRALWVGTGGALNLAVIMQNGATVTFNNVASGTLLPVRVSRVKSTGTTVSNIVALW